jgi:hypothetical protein
MQATPWHSRRKPTGRGGGEYFVSWFVGQIPADAVRVSIFAPSDVELTAEQVPERGTGMPDEVNYVAQLLPIEEVRRVLADYPSHLAVVEMAWWLWQRTKAFYEQDRLRKEADGWEDVEGGEEGAESQSVDRPTDVQEGG